MSSVSKEAWEKTGMLEQLNEEQKIEVVNILNQVLQILVDRNLYGSHFAGFVVLPVFRRLYGKINFDVNQLFDELFQSYNEFEKTYKNLDNYFCHNFDYEYEFIISFEKKMLEKLNA